jgi:hypothetical protein
MKDPRWMNGDPVAIDDELEQPSIWDQADEAYDRLMED